MTFRNRSGLFLAIAALYSGLTWAANDHPHPNCESIFLADGTQIKLSPSEWNRTVGRAWAQALAAMNINLDGTLIEIAPGSQDKIGQGLAQLGFRGRVIIVEPHEASLKIAAQKYRELLRHAEVVELPLRIQDLVALYRDRAPQVAHWGPIVGIVSNHPLDDMIIGESLTKEDFVSFFSDIYDQPDPEHTRLLWNRISRKPHLAFLLARHVEVLWRTAIETIHPNLVLISQYASYYHREHKLDFAQELTLHTLERLQQTVGIPQADVARALTQAGQNPNEWIAYPVTRIRAKTRLSRQNWRETARNILNSPDNFTRFDLDAYAAQLGVVDAHEFWTKTYLLGIDRGDFDNGAEKRVTLYELDQRLSTQFGRNARWRELTKIFDKARQEQLRRLLAASIGVPKKFIEKAILTEHASFDDVLLAIRDRETQITVLRQKLKEKGLLP